MNFEKSNIVKIFNMIKSQKAVIIALMIASGLSALFTVLTTALSKEIIDSAVDKRFNISLTYLLIMVANIIAIILIRIFTTMQSEKTKAKIEMSIKSDVLSTILYSDYAAVKKYAGGDILNRLFNDVRIVANTVVNILPVICTTAVQAIGVLCVLWSIDYRLSLIAFFASVVMLIFVSVLRRSIKHLHKIMQQKEGVVWEYLREAVDRIAVVKVFDMYDYVLTTANERQNEHYAARMKKRNVSMVSGVGLFAAFQLGYLFVIAFGAYSLASDALSYGSFVAIIQLLPQVRGPISRMSSIVPAYYSMIASYERILELTHLSKDEKDVADALELYSDMNVIVFDDVCFRYDNRYALKHFSCRIKKGKIILIEGQSGIGKSTMLKLILGFYNIESGSIYVELNSGERIMLGAGTRSLFSFVPQGLMLFSGSIRDNLISANPEATDDMISVACKLCDVDKFASELEEGIDTQIGKNGSDLSEGQRQRIALARAVVSNAPIILLDEATSALDEETERTVLNNIKKIKDKTIIIISHKKAAETVCDEIINI